jgi:ketosteroid isomerase-like protein
MTAFAQSDRQKMFDAEKALSQAAADRGVKSAFLDFLADDAILFLPTAVNGKDYWKLHDEPTTQLVRNMTFGDVSSNGRLGYTTGNWRLYQKGKSESGAEFGQYVTVWEKKPDGNFRASLDIRIRHEKLSFKETNHPWPVGGTSEANAVGWSAADPSMNFLKMSMSYRTLGGAYDEFADKDVRLLRDGAPPIVGKKNVVKATKQYTSVAFPRKVALLETGDMAYVWNVCEFSDNNEGREQGNCLHIWKLHGNKWRIVMGVFAAIPNTTPPVLKTKPKEGGSQ